MLTGLAFLGLFVVLNPRYNYADTRAEWFARMPLIYRFAFFDMNTNPQSDCQLIIELAYSRFAVSSSGPNTMRSGHLQRYVAVILFFEYVIIVASFQGASILTGLGFTGYTSSGASLWEGAANVDIMNIEFAPNFKVLLDSWNMKTNVWLRECMYKRVTPKGKKGGFRESMLTFATSAFWVCASGFQ
jgi:lysophospholipid acyltransferase